MLKIIKHHIFTDGALIYLSKTHTFS